jgi:ABC-type antimicrobial peptide transport system permease subunit
MLMFVIEAAIQGIVGGLIGLVLGIVLALLRGLVEFGTLLGEAGGALGQVGIAAVLSLLVGMVLATVAAVGPSFVAARLAPMEAMRVD